MGKKTIPTDGENQYALLTAEELASVTRRLALTPRQAEIVALLLQAKRDKQIAFRLGLSVATVRMHLSRIFSELGVGDRVELVVLVMDTARQAE